MASVWASVSSPSSRSSTGLLLGSLDLFSAKCFRNGHLSHQGFSSFISMFKTLNFLLNKCLLWNSGWQKLAAFRREQKWPQQFLSDVISYFRDKCVVFARKCKFTSLIEFKMQYISCNSALLAQETLFLTPKALFSPKIFRDLRKNATKLNIATT